MGNINSEDAKNMANSVAKKLAIKAGNLQDYQFER
jgi:hypothetical protein